MTPNDLATSTPSGQQTTLNFTTTGIFSLTAQATNTCGVGVVSDGFSVKVVDISAMEAENAQLKLDTALYRKQVRDSTVVINNLRIDITLFSNLVNYYRNDSIPELHGIITTVTEERDAALAANITLQDNYNQAVADSTAAGITYRNTIADLNTANTTLQDNYNQAVADSTAAGIAYRNTIADLNYDIITMQNDINDLLAGIDQLEADKLALQNQISDLEQEILDLQALIDGGMQDLLDQIEQLEAEKLALQEQVDDLTSQLATAISERDVALARINAIATLLGVDVANIENQITLLQQVYVLSWEVTEVVTSVFETEIGNFSISLYPNPSPGQVFIECTQQIKTISLFTLQGTLIKQFDNINATETSFTVNRSELSTGVFYIVRITNANGQYVTNQIIFQ
jgi:uncharacterized protein (UPF0335 family)